MTIVVDMDGILADLDRHYIETIGHNQPRDATSCFSNYRFGR